MRRFHLIALLILAGIAGAACESYRYAPQVTATSLQAGVYSFCDAERGNLVYVTGAGGLFILKDGCK